MNLVESLFGPNYRTTLSGFATTAAAVITALAILPEETWKNPQVYIPAIIAILAKSLKDVNTKDAAVSGNGSAEDPARKLDPKTNTSTIVQAIALLLLPAICFSSCGTPTGIATANFLQSPANQAVVDFAVRAGVNSLMASQGNNIPDAQRQALTDAATAAASTLSTGIIFASAQALRTKQSTPQAAAQTELATAAAVQGGAPPQAAQPIAVAVQSIAAQGASPDAANEAVAVALDAVALARTRVPAAGSGKTIIPPQALLGRPHFRATPPELRVLATPEDQPIYPLVVLSEAR